MILQNAAPDLVVKILQDKKFLAALDVAHEGIKEQLFYHACKCGNFDVTAEILGASTRFQLSTPEQQFKNSSNSKFGMRIGATFYRAVEGILNKLEHCNSKDKKQYRMLLEQLYNLKLIDQEQIENNYDYLDNLIDRCKRKYITGPKGTPINIDSYEEDLENGGGTKSQRKANKMLHQYRNHVPKDNGANMNYQIKKGSSDAKRHGGWHGNGGGGRGGYGNTHGHNYRRNYL
jgi:hypothetical protein